MTSLPIVPDGLGPEVMLALEAQRTHVHGLTRHFARRRTKEATIQIGKNAQKLGDEAFERFTPGGPPDDLGCKEGCSSCCFFHVDATWPEVFYLAETIMTSWSEKDREALIGRLRSTVDKIKGLDVDKRGLARVPCALLQNDRCSAYETRPLKCRSCTSFSKKACKRSLRPGRAPDIPTWAVPLFAYDPVFTGVAGGLREAGLSGTVELNRGLLEVLTNEDAMTAWWDGRLGT